MLVLENMHAEGSMCGGLSMRERDFHDEWESIDSHP